MIKRILAKTVPVEWLYRIKIYLRSVKNFQKKEDRGSLVNSAITLNLSPADRLKMSERKCFSQYGEDGIIEYIFSRIGVTNSQMVEVGFGAMGECHSTNLLKNHGWRTVMVDGEEANLILNRKFYEKVLKIDPSRFMMVHDFVTAENINEIIASNGVSGDIDLLSIDVDGNDYWLWDAISVINPRVVVIEYNATFGIKDAIATPYDPYFSRYKKHPSGFYHGASLSALAALAGKKGYALLGCESHGVNAFFARKQLLTPELPEVAVTEAYYKNFFRCQKVTAEEQFSQVQDLEYIHI